MADKIDLDYGKGLLLPAGAGGWADDCCCNNSNHSITRHPTLRAFGAAENDALKRRLLELELKYGPKVDHSSELQVLQSENNHFRELTYARLAEVEYWKKLYTNEKNAFEEKAEALRKEFEYAFDQEITRLTRLLSAAPSAGFHSEQKMWSQKVSSEKALLLQEKANLEKMYQAKLAEINADKSMVMLQQEKTALELQLASKIKAYEDSENNLKQRLAIATKEEVTKVLTRDYEYMQLMNSDILALKEALQQRDAIIAKLRQDIALRQLQVIQVPVAIDTKTQTTTTTQANATLNQGAAGSNTKLSDVPPPIDLAGLLGSIPAATNNPGPAHPPATEVKPATQPNDLLASFQQSLQRLQAQTAN